MFRLYGYPLCPFTRKVRLVLTEKRVPFDWVETRPWEADSPVRALNPAGQTPVLADGDMVLCDSGAIVEFLEETVQEMPLLGPGPVERAEVRRLTAWFDSKFYAEAGVLMLQERMWHRLYDRRPPDGTTLRRGLSAVSEHLKVIDGLMDRRRWLAGSTFSLADITAASHLSVVDYLGAVDWSLYPQVTQWYMTVKSRPSFKPIRDERMAGLAPPDHYARLDI
jgi:glutathione S-transferase